VAVVGGGLAGLSAAIELAQRGYRVIVLEARQVGWGASGRNGGQVIAGLACDQSVIERQLGDTASRAVWGMTTEALRLITERRGRFDIECDWRSGYSASPSARARPGSCRPGRRTCSAPYGYETQWIAPPRCRNGSPANAFIAACTTRSAAIRTRSSTASDSHVRPLRWV